MTCHLGTNGGDEAYSCHVCTANGFDFLYVFVALLIHELQNIHSNKHTKQHCNPVQISQSSIFKVKKKKSPSDLIKISNDLIQ